MHLLQEDASKHIRFSTANTERMRIDSSGNVGIGTTSPSRQLEIYDDGTNGQAVLALTAQNTDSSRIMFADPDDNNIGILDYSHADDSLRFVVNNSERMRLDSSGKVGIGTSSPTSKLTLNDNSANVDLLELKFNNSPRLTLDLDGSWNNFEGASGNGHKFTTTGGALFAIQNGGNVGIGTDSPDSLLDLESSGFGFEFNPNSGSSFTQHIFKTDTTDNNKFIIGYGASHGTAHMLALKSNNAAGSVGFFTASTEKMRIDSSGDVEVKTGNLVIGTSGKGIDFSAYGAGTNIDSNLLDDYEEGTWTPTFTSGNGLGDKTITSSLGRYVKVGNVVTITGWITVSANWTVDGRSYINNAPFNPLLSDVARQGGGSWGADDPASGDGSAGMVRAGYASNTITLYETAGSACTDSQFIFGVTYITT